MNFKIKIEWHLSTSDKETISEFEVTDFQTGDLLAKDCYKFDPRSDSHAIFNYTRKEIERQMALLPMKNKYGY
jgi:hypothetical protein